MVEIRALGAFEARVGGAAADLGGTRQQAVLARLVAARGRMVPVERLIEDLWPGEAPPRALAGVQAFVSHLRRALEPGRPPRTPAAVLVTRVPGYALRLEEAAVDVWRFEALVRRSAEGETALADAEAALELWRGPAYAEFADLPWAEAEAARLDGLRLAAVERRAAALLDGGAAARALPDLEEAANEHPLREELWRLLALGLYRVGRQADALGALRRVRSLLAEELGVDPGPALQRLERDILRQEDALTAGGAAPPAPLAPRKDPAPRVEVRADPAGSEPFVGREEEVAEVLAAVRAGRRVVLLSGEAGAGKTALAGRIRRELADRGWHSAWGRTPEVDGAPTGWAWAELLRALHARHPAPAALAPMLDDDAPAPGGDLSVARFRLHRAVGRYLAEVGAQAPLVLVLEDLHRADEETLALLAGLPAQAPDVLFVGTYRSTQPSERLADALAALARHEPVRIALGGLAPDAVADLVGRVCRTGVAAETLAAIAERTAGNPFFVRETARLLDAEGPEAALREVPSGVGDVLRRRVSRLPATAGTVLRTAAVMGREVDPDVLVRVCALEEEAVLDALEAALITGLMTEDDTGLRFAHVLVRDTLYAEVSRLRRGRLHGRVAEALEELRPTDSAALAHHHLEAGTRLDRAVVHASRAAEAAEARFAHRAAVDLWAGALEAHGRAGGEVAARMELTARLVRALVLSGDVVTARIRRQEALPALEGLADAELAARVLTAFDTPMLWGNRIYGTRDDRLIAAMEAVLERLPRGETRARLLTSVALELDSDPDGRGGEAAEEAVALARDLGGGEILVHALNGLFNNRYRGADDVREREAIGLEMLALAERHSLGLYAALSHLSLHQNACGRLDFASSSHHLERGRELARRYELPLLVNLSAWRPCLDLTLAGRFAEAEAAIDGVVEGMARTSAFGAEEAIAWCGRFSLMFAQDRLAELTGATEMLWRNWPHGAACDAYALTLAASGRLPEAREVFARIPPIRVDYLFDLHMALRGLAAVAVGDAVTAAEVHRLLLPHAAGFVGTYTTAVAMCPVSWVLGEIAVFLGREEEAAEHFARAAETARRAGSAHWEERCLARLA